MLGLQVSELKKLEEELVETYFAAAALCTYISTFVLPIKLVSGLRVHFTIKDGNSFGLSLSSVLPLIGALLSSFSVKLMRWQLTKASHSIFPRSEAGCWEAEIHVQHVICISATLGRGARREAARGRSQKRSESHWLLWRKEQSCELRLMLFSGSLPLHQHRRPPHTN